MKFTLKYFFLFGSLLFSMMASSQVDTVTVVGKISDADNPYVWMPAMIVNKSTGKGAFADNGGKFLVRIKKTDTLIINATGYIQQKFCFKDSTGSNFSLQIKLSKQPIVLKEATVKPERDLTKIEEDIKTLKKEEVNTVTGINVAKSPITALYERFSSIGRQKNLVAEMEYEDKRRELLKELLAKYVRYDIIDLGMQDFDKFIDYLNLPDEFIRESSQYDLIMAIKYRYEIWEAWKN